MEFRTHEKNIQQIRATVEAYGEIWVHGDGNLFPVYVYNPLEPNNQDESKTHSENFNRGYEEASYRVKINKTNMPKNKAELDRLLVNSKMQDEMLKRQALNSPSKVMSVQVNDSHFGNDVAEPAGEIDYSKYKR